MATAVKSVTFLWVSASPGFSSAKLSSSLVSSIHAKWRLPGFKGINIWLPRPIVPVTQDEKPKDHPVTQDEKPEDHPAAFEDTRKILAELNTLRDEMKQLRSAIDSASKILSTAVSSYKGIQPINEVGLEVREPKTEETAESFTPILPLTWKENGRRTQSKEEKSTENIERGGFKRRSPSIRSEEDYPRSKKLRPGP